VIWLSFWIMSTQLLSQWVKKVFDIFFCLYIDLFNLKRYFRMHQEVLCWWMAVCLVIALANNGGVIHIVESIIMRNCIFAACHTTDTELGMFCVFAGKCLYHDKLSFLRDDIWRGRTKCTWWGLGRSIIISECIFGGYTVGRAGCAVGVYGCNGTNFRIENHKQIFNITILITKIDYYLFYTIKNHTTSQTSLN
jgi:hypothetical protein